MKEVRRHHAATFVSLLALLASTFAGLVPGGAGRAGLKLARVRDVAAVGARHEAKPSNRISDELLDAARSADGRRVRVILQTGDGAGTELAALLRRRDVKTKGRLPGLGARVVELPAQLVERLSEQSGVRFIS